MKRKFVVTIFLFFLIGISSPGNLLAQLFPTQSVSRFSVFSSYFNSNCPFGESLTYAARIEITQEADRKLVRISMCGVLQGNVFGPTPRTQFNFEIFQSGSAAQAAVLIRSYPTTIEEVPLGNGFFLRLFRFSIQDQFILEASGPGDDTFLSTSTTVCQIQGVGNRILLNQFAPVIGDFVTPRAYVAVPSDDKTALQDALRSSPYSGSVNDPTIDCVFSQCPSISSFGASPSSVSSGGSATLSWDVSNLGSNHVRIFPTVGVVADATRSNFTVTPSATTTYTLDIVDPAGNPVPCAGSRQTVVSILPANRFFGWRVERRAPVGGPTPGYVYPPFQSESLRQFDVSGGQNPALVEPFNSQAAELLAQWQSFDSDVNQPGSLAGQFEQRLKDFKGQTSAEWCAMGN